MAIAQSILDAQAKLDSAIAAVSDKVDALITASASAMTPDDIAAVASKASDQAAALEAVLSKS